MGHRIGLIHGRFQVLHNDHLVYLLAGKERCDHLIIGVTNPSIELTETEASNPERSDPANNPLTYEERETMIRMALKEADISADTFSIIPFPICRPEILSEMAPREAVYFLTIYDKWGHEKLKRLGSLGLQTEIMWEKTESEKGLSGRDVRRAIRDNDGWQSMVPPAVAKLVESWNLQERLNGSSKS
jgi:nicotinamide-nucleotide adenylyltransferase